jgi:hypothetical protein
VVHVPETSQQRQTLEIVLEDAGARSWLAALLATLASQHGNAFMRFVAQSDRADGVAPRVVAKGGTFARPRSVPDDVPPDESYCPGMTATLDDLRARLEKDGWQPSGRGAHPWSYRYEKDAAPAE